MSACGASRSFVNTYRTAALFLILSILFSCGEGKKEQRKPASDKALQESLIKANQYLMRNENADIDAYIARHKMGMTKTQTGLRYCITAKGNGPLPAQGKTVSIEYSVSLINGEKLYDSAKDGLKTFVLGKDSEIPGLEEGIFLLRQGDQAKFIIPSHLAYGLAGDDKKVPRRATLLYDVKLISVK